jgi:hypothetical protein
MTRRWLGKSLPTKEPLPGIEVRRRILEHLYAAWKQATHPDFFIDQKALADAIAPEVARARWPETDQLIFDGAWKDLEKENLIERPRESVQNRQNMVRITYKGKEDIEEAVDSKRTRALALLGAVTGVLALVVSTINMSINIINTISK